MKILLVEANNYHSLLLENEIRHRFNDLTIMHARSGKEALEILKVKCFDTAIVDLDLPNGDGLELLRLLHYKEHNLPIIVIASDNSEEVAKKVFECGVEELLVKNSSFHVIIPILIDEVCQRKVLSNKQFDNEDNLKEKERADIIKITAGTLAHEINNPLMTILGISELIIDNNYNYAPELIKKMRIIKKSARRIQSTLKRLSIISKPALKNTISGKLIDQKKSKMLTKSVV